MNIFETVKSAIPVRQAAEYYGLQICKNNMTCCLFHPDKHPSMKLNDDYYYCFGCGATGDVIDLTAQLFDLGKFEAAKSSLQISALIRITRLPRQRSQNRNIR